MGRVWEIEVGRLGRLRWERVREVEVGNIAVRRVEEIEMGRLGRLR